jgi:hypothetical protein
LYSPLKNSICQEFAVFPALFPTRCLALASWLKGKPCASAFALARKPLGPENRSAANLNDQACEIERAGLTMAQAEEWLDWLENNDCNSRNVKWRQDEKLDLYSAPHRQ